VPTPPEPDYGSTVTKFAHAAFPNLSRDVAGTILNHYTSLETSQRILESKTFRLTHVHSMNDYEEMRYGLHMFYELVTMFNNSANNEEI